MRAAKLAIVLFGAAYTVTQVVLTLILGLVGVYAVVLYSLLSSDSTGTTGGSTSGEKVGGVSGSNPFRRGGEHAHGDRTQERHVDSTGFEMNDYYNTTTSGAGSSSGGVGLGSGRSSMSQQPMSRPHSRARSIANAMFGTGSSSSIRSSSPSTGGTSVNDASTQTATYLQNGSGYSGVSGGLAMPKPVHGIDPSTLTRPRRRVMANAPLSDLTLTTSVRRENRVLTKEVANEIRALLPARLQLHDEWRCVYSLDEHGVSLSTLYGRCDANRGLLGDRPGFVVVVQDADAVIRHGSGSATPIIKGGEGDDSNGRRKQKPGVFGAFLNEHPRPAASYYGNGECYLFKTHNLPPPLPAPTSTSNTLPNGTSSITSSGCSGGIRFKAFPWTGLNDYQIYCTSEFLSLGGGDEGKYALWLDDRLEKGVSETSSTFGNEPLCDGVEAGRPFDIVGVEVWRI